MATRVVALWAALFIVLAAVVPVLAVEGPTKLDNAAVSPRTGLPTTTITFAVRYRNREGSPPDHVNVVVDGAAHRLSGAGTSWKSGVVLEWSTRLAVGTHSISFEAADTRKFTDAIDAGSVTITAPPSPTPAATATPRPTPKPSPTAAPTSAPTTAPTPKPTPSSGSGAAVGSPGSTPSGADAGSGSSSTPSPTAPPALGTGFGPGPDGTGSGGATGGPAGFGGGAPGDGSSGGETGGGNAGAGGLASGDTNAETTSGSARGGTGAFGSAVGTAGIGPDARGGAPAGSGWGTLARALDALGVRPSATTTILPMLVGTTTATAMAFAFAIFGKKRRDEEPPASDEVLQAQAARGVAVLLGGEVVGVVRAPAVPAPIDAEAGMPRWRRPSLI